MRGALGLRWAVGAAGSLVGADVWCGHRDGLGVVWPGCLALSVRRDTWLSAGSTWQEGVPCARGRHGVIAASLTLSFIHRRVSP